MKDVRVIYEDVVGARSRTGDCRISTLTNVPVCLRDALQHFYRGDLTLTPPQHQALLSGALDKKACFLVSAPTNSGKTLIAILRIFSNAISGRQRSVYVVPLKALAEEKFFEFYALANEIKNNRGPAIQISISTGDYQLTQDFLGSPPPECGEIVICTPERLEVMLRNPDNYHWARAVGTYVIDEFHLLGDRRRGATVETLLTRLLISCPWSAILGLSATVGDLDRICNWFRVNDRELVCIDSDYRYPQLHRRILLLEDKASFIEAQTRRLFETPDQSMLIFVHTKRDAENLAQQLQEFSNRADGIAYYHAGLSLDDRKQRLLAFREQKLQLLVTTTSLKMGVNFPVTQVVIRDHVLNADGRATQLTISDVLQMMGRAGRKDKGGEANLLCSAEEDAERYRDGMACGRIDEITPQLIRGFRSSRVERNHKSSHAIDPIHGVMLTELTLRGRATLHELYEFISRTYSANDVRLPIQDLQQSIDTLERGKLIYKVEESEDTYTPTKLGKTVSLCGLSPESGAVLAGFLRALINLSEKSKESGQEVNYLRRLHDLDLLFLAVTSYEARNSWIPWPRATKAKEKAVKDVAGYLETLDPEEKPLVNLWRSEESTLYPTRRLLSSLQIHYEAESPENRELLFQQIMRTAIFLHRHSQGVQLDTLCLEYGVYTGTIESGLKYTVTWVLHCLAQICSPEKCYKLDFLAMRIHELLEDLSLGATLGKLLSIEGVGRRSVQKLIDAGYTTLETLNRRSGDDLLEVGLTMKQAAGVLRYVARMSR